MMLDTLLWCVACVFVCSFDVCVPGRGLRRTVVRDIDVGYIAVVCVYAYIYICVCVCVCIYIYIYIYICVS